MTKDLPLGPGDPDNVSVDIPDPSTPSILTQAEQTLASDAPAHVTGGLIIDGKDVGVGVSVKSGEKKGWSAAAVWQWTKQKGHQAAAMVGWKSRPR